MNKKYLKYGANFFFLLLFLMFSGGSLYSWIQGDVVYNLVHRVDNDLMFPSVTVCPTQDINPLMNIKVRKIMNDFNLSNEEVNGYKITNTLSKLENLTSIVEDYSYGFDSSFENEKSTAFRYKSKSFFGALGLKII